MENDSLRTLNQEAQDQAVYNNMKMPAKFNKLEYETNDAY